MLSNFVKKLFSFCFVILAGCFSVLAYASPEVEQPCSQLDLRQVVEDTRCSSSTGVVFRLQKRTSTGVEIWEDRSSGFMWSDTLKGRFTHEQAMTICQSDDSLEARGQIQEYFFVPDRHEWEVAEEHGIREILPNMKGYGFWTSSVYNPHPNWAHFFLGTIGTIGTDMRDSLEFVRCAALY